MEIRKEKKVRRTKMVPFVVAFEGVVEVGVGTPIAAMSGYFGGWCGQHRVRYDAGIILEWRRGRRRRCDVRFSR